jgi:hypothetical protein
MLESEYEEFLKYCQTGIHELVPKPIENVLGNSGNYKGLSKEEKRKAMHINRLKKAALHTTKLNFS